MRGKFSTGTALGALSFAAVVLGTSMAWSEEAADEIIVTARRRDENIQKVPVAVTAISSEKLDKFGTLTSDDLNKMAPSLHVYGQNAQHDQLVMSIRGEGLTFNTLFPAVIPYLAEVPVPNLVTGAFFDLDNLQVLRGPQGVRFGRVTDGGALLISPKRPTNDLGGYIEAGLGDYNMYSLGGAVNVPIVKDKVLLRIAGELKRRDGSVRNIVDGKDLDDLHTDSGRIGLILRPSDRFENYTMFQYQFVASNGTGLFISRVDPAFIGDPRVPAALAQQQALDAQYGKGRYVANDPHDGDKRTHYYLVNKSTWDVTDKFQIKNIVSYTFEKDFQFPELDGTGLDILRDIPIDGVPYISKDQMSEELQFNGKAIGDALNWTIGGYWDRQQPKGKMGYGVLAFGSIINNVAGHIQSEEWAGYASAELDLSRWVLQGLKVNGGVRKTWDSSEACQSEYLSIAGTTAPVGSCVGFTDIFIGPVPAAYHKANFHKVTYEIGFSYQATPDVFLYGSLRSGYRPGGFNLSSLGAASDYQQESLQEFEIGAKTNWHLGSVRGRTNIALFHDRLANAQRNVNIVIGPTVNSSVVNSATGHIQGIELENTVQLTEALQIGFNWAYTDTKYVNNLSSAGYAAACTVTPAQINVGFCPDNLFNNAPKNQIIGSIDYTLPLSDRVGMVSLGMNVDYRSTAALNDYSIIDPSQVIPGYARFDFYANWKEIFGSRVDLIGFVTNAFDDRSPQSTVPLLHQVNFGMGSYTYNYPRMFGFRARYTFGAE